MAYYLAFAGGGGSGGQYVSLTSRIDIQSGDDFSIFADVRIANNTTTYRMLGGDNLADTGPRVLIFGGGSFRLYNTAGAFQSWPIGVNLTTIETIEFRRVSGTLDLLINGVVQSGTKTGNTDTYLGVQVINGNGNAASENANDLYRLQFTINDVLVHDYNPSTSGGTGLVLTDTVGGNNGTLVNFPADDTQWVYYDDGGGTPTEFPISITSNTFLPTSVVSLDNLPPEYSTIINSLALLPTSNVSLENTDPSYTVTVLSEALLPTASIVLGNDKPIYSSTVASNTFLPVSVGVLSNSPPEYLSSISSATLLPTSNVNLTPEAPNTSLSIFSSTLLPSSVVALNSAAPSGLSVVSNTLLPTSTVELDNQYVGVSTVTSNTLLPVSNIVLGATVPEDSIVVLSNAPLPTSIVLLSNGSVVYSVGNKNSLTIKPINNNVSIKTKSNFIQLR